MPSPIWISEEWQPWPDKNSVRFKTIGALYSEFIALSEIGEMHQWRWSDLEPYKSDVSIRYKCICIFMYLKLFEIPQEI